jgi:hypothetical protein
MTSATASPTAASTAVAPAVSAAIISTVTASAIVLAGTVIAAAGRIVLCGIVMWRKVLRRRRIGFRLALVASVSVLVFRRSGRSCVAVILYVIL